jgi:homocysteine S-methyltransferase
MTVNNPLSPFLQNNGFLVLDGGLATELEARGHDLNDELWSASLLIDDIGSIRRLHEDYLAAGADCIISASYQGTIPGFMKHGLSQAEAEDLIRLSVTIALEARDAFWKLPKNRFGRIKPIVAASVGPYGAYLADGSEYTGEYDLNQAELMNFHRPRWQILAGTQADIMACETIPSFTEAMALSKLLENTADRVAWFSFCCRDFRRISDGTLLADCLAHLDQIEQITAVGINCTAPRFIPSLVAEARSATQKPILVYPNSGETYDIEHKRWLGETDSQDFAAAALSWCAAGASLIGGCCRTGPEHIRHVRQILLAQS